MGDFYVDIFATKGLEYLLVIVFLASLVLFWRMLNRPGKGVRLASTGEPSLQPTLEWFALADDRYYHQGHSWVRPDDGDVVRIGIDDFAQRLLGPADEVLAPREGARLEQGESGWRLR